MAIALWCTRVVGAIVRRGRWGGVAWAVGALRWRAIEMRVGIEGAAVDLGDQIKAVAREGSGIRIVCRAVALFENARDGAGVVAAVVLGMLGGGQEGLGAVALGQA